MKKIVFLSFCIVLSASLNAQTVTEPASSKKDSKEGLAELSRKIRRDFYLGAFASGLDPSKKDNDQEKLICSFQE